MTMCLPPKPRGTAAPGQTDSFGIGLMRCLGAVLLVAALTASAQGQSSVTLAWDPSSDSSIAGYRLYEGAASRSYTNVINTGKATTATVSNLVSGITYFFAVTAYDTNGQESGFSSEISYTVPWSPNDVPSIALASPTNGAVYTAPATINLAAAVTAKGHTITQVQFFNGATLLGAIASAPYGFSWNNLSAGTYSLRAKAIYDSGKTVDSVAVNVKVAAGRPGPSLVFAGTPPTLRIQTAPGGSVVLSATGQPGQTYNVLCSQNLTAWIVIGTVTADTSGAFAFTDPIGTKSPIRLYRLQLIGVPPPKLQIRASAGGPVRLSGTGQAGQTYNVLCSQNLKDWTVIGAVTIGPSGAFSFTDPTSSTRPSGMYRLQGR
jgi:hypothetical protein